MKTKRIFFVLLVFAAVIAGVSCSSDPKVRVLDSRTQTQLSGDFNDSDVITVCDALVAECVTSPILDRALAERKGKTPFVLVNAFENNTSEHIDTAIISDSIERSILKSGKLRFVQGGKVRDQIRSERLSQQTNASEETAKRLGRELGADFLMSGSIRGMNDRAGNRSTRSYYVTIRLVDIETSEVVFSESKDIKKEIVRPGSRL